MTIFFIIAALVLLALVLAAIRALGDGGTIEGITGERLTEAALERGLDPKSYRQIHDVTLPGRLGTIQIDHLVLSRFGVFVLESKHLFGEIVAQADSKTWTQTLGENRTTTFQNPLRENPARIRALAAVTGLGEGAFLPLVVVTGEGTFKTGMPEGVVGLDGLADRIQRLSAAHLSGKQLDAAQAAIEAARVSSGRGTGQALVAGLRERFGGTSDSLLARLLKHRRQTLEGLRLAALALVMVVTWGSIDIFDEARNEGRDEVRNEVRNEVRGEREPIPTRTAASAEPDVTAPAAGRSMGLLPREQPDAPLPIIAPSLAFEPLPQASASASASAAGSAPASTPPIFIEPDPPVSRPAKLGTVPPPSAEERILSTAAQRRQFEETLDCEVTGVFRDCSCYMDAGAKVLVAEERCRSLAQYNGVRWISRPE